MTERTAPGWHSDPSGRYEHRYWDGSRWTQHVGTGGRQGIDGPVIPSAAPRAIAVRPAAGWYPDPAGRGGHRYWDGIRWTDHAQAGGRQALNPSPNPATAPPAGRPNNKVSRQARNAGAAANQRGGGTLFTEQVLVVNQKAKVFGSTLGYAVYNQNGHQLGTVQEVRRDLSTKIGDGLRGRPESKKSHRFRVVDMNGRVLLEMTRPSVGWFRTKGKMVIEGPGSTPIGQIVHESFGVGGNFASAAHLGITNASAIVQFGLGGFTGAAAGLALGGVQDRLDSAVEGLDKVGHARFGLEAGGERLGSIHAESTTQWDFNVQDPTGSEVARITKTWAGWTKERFTKADNYVVQMHRPLAEPLRSLVIAAALAIDVELKQHGDQTSGSSVWGTRRYA
jgi:sporulation protein YlmC with PRC-barrel domain